MREQAEGAGGAGRRFGQVVRRSGLSPRGSRESRNELVRKRWIWLLRWSGVTALLLGVLSVVARIVLVRNGILYGTSAVAQVDALVAALVALGAALLVLAWSLSRRRPRGGRTVTEETTGDEPRPAERWSESVSALIALGSVITAVITSLNLFVPATPTSLATGACPGVPVRHSNYTGLTVGEEGVNSRSGPSRAFPPNGRLPKGCSVGFEFFCLGEPILDRTGSTGEVTWVTTRWLAVSRQRSSSSAWLANFVSGEIREDRYISDAFITPQTRYDQLPYGDGMCRDRDRYPLPDKAGLVPFNAVDGTLTARAKHARNMGFAVFVPGNAGFAEVPRYVQIYTPGVEPIENPGQTGSSGEKSVRWRYRATLAAELSAERGTVTVMAVPCLADNIPASVELADYAGYELTRDGEPTLASSFSDDFEKEQLARIACGANT